MKIKRKEYLDLIARCDALEKETAILRKELEKQKGIRKGRKESTDNGNQ